MSSFISEILVKLVNETGISFTLDGVSQENEFIFANDSALPFFAYYADSLRSEALGDKSGLKLGANIEGNSSGLFSLVVDFDSQVPESVQVLMMSNAIIEFTNSLIPEMEIKNFDDIKDYVAKVRLSKKLQSYDLVELPLDSLAATAAYEITPERSIQNILNAVKV